MISILRFAGVSVLQTLLRVLPFPCRTGLVQVGNPGRDAPVLLTCNYGLTVARVKRALRGFDAYLLVANSRGVNVWCAATGGLFTHHDVVSVLKTSGIGDLVDHRRLILPQLAATGIEGKIVYDRTGWRVVWGPVYAAALPAFLEGGCRKTASMGRVGFPWTQRLEMALAWAFPMSLFALLVLPFWSGAVIPLIAVIWGLALLIFLTFPLYQRYLGGSHPRTGFVFFDFGQQAVWLFVWVLFMVGAISYGAVSGDLSWGYALRWALVSLVVVFVLSLDLMGSTPVYKSGLHKERLLRVTLDRERCKGAGICEQICPRGVFEVDPDYRRATLARSKRCVRCGACIVQCPFDALHFRTLEGGIVTPETVRRFKLNLVGNRVAGSRGG